MKYQNWSFSKWKLVIFSDESNFQLINRKNIPYVRRMIEEKYDKRHCVMTRLAFGDALVLLVQVFVTVI
jgi:hypothetical protein